MGVAARCVAATLFLAVIAGTPLEAASDTSNPAKSHKAVQAAIDAAARYLMRATRLDGSFEYRVNANPAVSVTPRYNVLRHAGAIYAMATDLGEQPNAAVRDAVLRAGGFLKDRTVAPVPDADGLLAVWSKPEITKGNKPLQAKLGGAGLGLVALAKLETIRPGFTPIADLRALGRFIVFMQKPDGGFHSKFIPSTGGRDDSWTSLYYPGEAALGLLMLYELDRDRRWFDAAGRALAYLARARENDADVPADHWALLATAKMLSFEDARIPSELRSKLESHAVQICTAILADQVDDPGAGALHGGFSADGRVTPTATRLEGLLAARSFLPPGTAIAARIDGAIDSGMAFLLRAQITEGNLAGGFPRAIAPLPPDAEKADSFNRRATEVRIDYVQHALSALIQYRATVRP